MKKIGANLVALERQSSEYFQKFLEGETKKWNEIFKAAGATLD